MGDFHWQKDISYYNIAIIRYGAKNSVVTHRNPNVKPTHKSNVNFRNAPALAEAIATRVAQVATSAVICGDVQCSVLCEQRMLTEEDMIKRVILRMLCSVSAVLSFICLSRRSSVINQND
jgi:hypothetical protein